MRFIPTWTHGIADYLLGVALIVAPFILGFAIGGVVQWLPMAIGSGILAMAVMTNYEFATVRLISMPVHLTVDFGAGLLLAMSPWVFGFSHIVFWPHLIFGLLEMGASLTTHTRLTEYEDAYLRR